MKLAYWSICLMSLGLFGGCSSKVITYNTTGHVIGSCTAKSSLMFKGEATCYGYSNLEGLSFSKPQFVSAYGLTTPKPLPSSALAKDDVKFSSSSTIAQQNNTPKPSIKIENLPTPPSYSRITLLPNQEPLSDLNPRQKINLFNETPTLD